MKKKQQRKLGQDERNFFTRNVPNNFVAIGRWLFSFLFSLFSLLPLARGPIRFVVVVVICFSSAAIQSTYHRRLAVSPSSSSSSFSDSFCFSSFLSFPDGIRQRHGTKTTTTMEANKYETQIKTTCLHLCVSTNLFTAVVVSNLRLSLNFAAKKTFNIFCCFLLLFFGEFLLF